MCSLGNQVTKVTRIGRNRTCSYGLVSPHRSPRLGSRHREERGTRLPRHFLSRQEWDRFPATVGLLEVKGAALQSQLWLAGP